MRAIARNLVVIAGMTFTLAFAGAPADILDLFASMTSALANGNPPGFMNAFDKKMENYGKLSSYVAGMIAEAEVSSSIDPIKDEGDDNKRSLDLDWTLQLRSRQISGPLVQREQTIHAELVKEKKHWRIVSISSLDFFAPPQFSPSK